MVHIPRFTRFFQARAMTARQEIQDMMADPVIRDAYAKTLVALKQVFAHTEGVHFPLTHEQTKALQQASAADQEDYASHFALLITLIRQRAPQVVRRWDDHENHLEQMIFSSLCHNAGVEPPFEEGGRMARLSPNNPILRLAENVYYIPEDVNEFGNADQRLACLMELDGYFTSIQEDKKRGRPAKDSNSKPTPRENKKQAEWDAKAIKAHQTDQDRKDKGEKKDWKTIAEAVGYDVPRYDRSAQKRLNSTINRLLHRGRILSTPPE